ncbi:unnamed protein product [Discosporangium mesarthrocarpum]
MQALLVLEDSIKREWLAPWWTSNWASPAVAMRVTTVQAVSFRLYALDSAILYEGATNGTHEDAPLALTRQRGRPKKNVTLGQGAESSAYPAGGPARLWKGHHADTCAICNLGGTLLCCDFCPMAYHMQPCLKINKEPVGTWACPHCRKEPSKPEKPPRKSYLKA